MSGGNVWAFFMNVNSCLLKKQIQKKKKKFRFIWQSGIGGEDFKKSSNQKQELPVAAMFVNGSG